MLAHAKEKITRDNRTQYAFVMSKESNYRCLSRQELELRKGMTLGSERPSLFGFLFQVGLEVLAGMAFIHFDDFFWSTGCDDVAAA